MIMDEDIFDGKNPNNIWKKINQSKDINDLKLAVYNLGLYVEYLWNKKR